MPVFGDPSCKLCTRYASAPLVCVMGQGPVPCDIMIVGEAPTIHRSDLTKPFSGNAGRLLDRILMENGVSRENIYMSNVIHCAAPENESPSQAEIKACKAHLLKEIEEVKPKYIILLGAVALKGVLGKGASGIMDLHGNPIEKDGITYLPAFHPAAALRDPKKEAPLKADLKKFFEIINGTWKPSTGLNLTVVRTREQFEDMVQDLTKSPIIGFDLETSGLDQWEPEGKVNCIGLSRFADGENLTGERQFVMPIGTGDGPFKDPAEINAALQKIHAATVGKKVISQNGKFDNLWLRVKHGVKIPITYDTMIAAHLLDENSPCGLKYQAKVYLNAPNYDIDSETKRGEVDNEKMYEYCGYDVLYTLRLYKYQKPLLLKDQDTLRIFKHLMMPAFLAFEDIEYAGVYVHKERFDALEASLKAELVELKAKLDELAPDVNWNSTKQVGKVLFEDWKLTPLEYTKGGSPSTAEAVLLRLRHENEGIKILLKYREVSKQVSSFIEGWKKFLGPDDRMHPNFKLHGTVTGRISCSDPNLQQVPRDKRIRTLIGAPPGRTFLECDYSQVELRIAAMISGDPTMLSIFNDPNGDIHRTTASVVTGKPPEEISKDERKKAKAVNFGFLYGMSAKKFMEYARDKYETNLSQEEAIDFRNRFFERYSGLPKWHQRQKIMVRQYGMVKGPNGRVRHLPDIMSPDEGVRAQAERNAINSPVQGFGSDMTMMAVIALKQMFTDDELRIVGTVHDAILMEVRDDLVSTILDKIKPVIEHPPLLEKFGVEIPLPIVTDAKWGDWGSE